MKALLNFIPADHRKTLIKEYVLRISTKVLILLFIILALFTATMYGAEYLMQSEIDRVVLEQENTRILINGDENATIESAIATLNTTTARLATIQSTYVHWTTALQRVEDLIIPGITVQSISMNSTEQTIVIQGNADTRETYFNFEASLNRSEFVDTVSLPLSLLKEEIPFNITLTVQPSFFNHEI